MRAIGWAVVALGVVGCAGPEAEYGDTLAQAKARVDAYEAVVASAPAQDVCAVERDRYRADLGPMMERMRQAGGGMQTCMGGMMGGGMQRGGMMGAEEGCRRMDDELAAYGSVGCASADPEVNRVEGLAHCTRMRATLDEMATRDCAR